MAGTHRVSAFLGERTRDMARIWITGNQGGLFPRCPVTEKYSFPSKMRAIQELQTTRNRGREEIRVYNCTHCNGWHLTSQQKREQ